MITQLAKRHALLILILLLAFGLRLYALTDIPPGLTHDEANHGREGMEVLDGVYRYFFPLNYGSEPIYSYTVAGSMGLLGENLFALRYVNVIFGLLTISISYAWSRRQFGHAVGVLTAVLLTFTFWPLASSRQALRAGMLPFFTTAAVIAFWHMARPLRKRHDSIAYYITIRNTQYAIRNTSSSSSSPSSPPSTSTSPPASPGSFFPPSFFTSPSATALCFAAGGSPPPLGCCSPGCSSSPCLSTWPTTPKPKRGWECLTAHSKPWPPATSLPCSKQPAKHC